jgi:3-isopropylmalate dehydrogenase
MPHIAVLGGDGIGPEVVAVAVAVIEEFGLNLAFDRIDDVSADRYLADGTILTDDEFARLCGADAILFGAVGDPRVTSDDYARGVILRLRAELDLYVNLRPATLFDRRLSPLRDERRAAIDLRIVRENTEGLYCGVGGTLHAGTTGEVAIDAEVSTYQGVSRIIDYAFSIARTSVCLVGKSNAVKFGGGLWERVWREAAAHHPELETRRLYVDAAAMRLVEDPSVFDVIVANNSHGDILSDLAAAVAGGIGIAASANLNPQQRKGLFEPIHGSAPDIAGQQIANPAGAVLSAAMLLQFLNYPVEACAIRDAVRRAIALRRCTADLGGRLSTAEAGDALLQELRQPA